MKKKKNLDIGICGIINDYINSFPYNKSLSDNQRSKLFRVYSNSIIKNKDLIKPYHVALNMLDFFIIADPIVSNPEYIKRKKFKHHGDESVYEHCLKVAFLCYNITRFFKCDCDTTRNVVIAGLLHDFYTKPWQDDLTKVKFFKQHGFVHAKEACLNANAFFPSYMNKRVENAIKRHMFPLNIIPPKYIESWIVSFSDKIISTSVLKEFKDPKKALFFIGITNRTKKD